MSDSTHPHNKTMVTGLFPDRSSAEQAFSSVSERGYTKDDINLVMSDEARRQHFSNDTTDNTELGTKAAQGAGIGGAIVAAIAAVGTSIAIPGADLVIAGPLAAALAGAGAGGAIGAAGGPVGMAAGAAIGALAGGAAGHGAARVVKPAEENAHCRSAFYNEPYVKLGDSYNDYTSAYRLGYTGAGSHHGDFVTAEPMLAAQWNSVKGGSKLTWQEAKEAVRAAWYRAGR